MIQVQIASQVTPTGVDGVRWVLVESADDTGGSNAAPVAGAMPPWAPGPDPTRSALATGARPRAPAQLSLMLLKLLVIGLGAGLALWLAQSVFGPVRLPWRPAQGNTRPAVERQPVPAAPALPASAATPLVTAELT